MEHKEFTGFTEAIERNCAALRAVALAAGPNAPVPNCPKWTINGLVRHIARVHSMTVAAIADPSGENVQPGTPPREWESLLEWWDERVAELREALADEPDRPAWLPFQTYPQTTGSWARRQAHESAIHLLDAESAAGTEPTVFEPEFAADGVDELLRHLHGAGLEPHSPTVSGSVLVRLTDVDRMWTVWLAPGQRPVTEQGGTLPAGHSATLTLSGPANEVYRAVWRRPHQAELTGDQALLEPLAGP